MYKRGEIVLVPVTFTDLSSVKSRPVLVISNIFHNRASIDMIAVAVTSNMRRSGIIIEAKDMASGKLPKPSLIRCEKIYTLEQHTVIKRFGIVTENVLNRVIQEINRLIT